MSVLFTLLLLAFPSLPLSSSGGGGAFLAEFPAPEYENYGDYLGITVDGCGTSDEAAIPVRHIRLPIEPGTTPSVRVEVTGVRSIGRASGIASSFFAEDGVESFREASPDQLPTEWGVVREYGVWRRAGYVEVALHPVILSDGELHHASGIRVAVEGPVSQPQRFTGREGLFLGSFFSGAESGFFESPSRTGSSPFWGRPWARIEVDTAGVFMITGEMIPEAVGMPSSSFSMYCGRGLNMSEESPWIESYTPVPVPILVEDGGDGVFSASDRILFFGRGLSWWDESDGFPGAHFNSMYDSRNTYWLTWGGEGGPFMSIQDASLTGAPSAGNTFSSRKHFEQNYIRDNNIPDRWAWGRFAGSHTQSATINFNTPGATGPGRVRVGVFLPSSISPGVPNRPVSVRAILNSVSSSDTVLTPGSFPGTNHTVFFDVEGFKGTGNSLSIQFSQTSGSYVVLFDWVSVFPLKAFASAGAVTEIPLHRNIPPGDRRRIDWGQSLGSVRAFLVSGDSLATALALPAGNSFETEVPQEFQSPVMFIYPSGNLPIPASVSPASPGRIRGTLSGGDAIVLYPQEFQQDIPLLDRPDGRNRVFVSLREVWDEFNGGVRDPQAVRAFMEWVRNSWHPLPSELVLVGSGHFDPRGFAYNQPCPMDVLVLRAADEAVSDDRYAVVRGSDHPQFGVSRVFASTRSELQLLAQRAWDYFAGEASGEWQTQVIAVPDDERHLSQGNISYSEAYHTIQTEHIIEDIPGRFFVDRQYGIFYTWNDAGKKPQWRADFIEAWSRGALVMFFMGHGTFDQIADEGLFYLEDAALLTNDRRLPYAFFGSCDVGMFQYPGRKCISAEVTLAQSGGSIASLGATVKTQGNNNRFLLKSIFSVLFSGFDLSISEATWLGKINHSHNDKRFYILFGEGSLSLALPDSGISHNMPLLYAGERANFQGSLEGREGLVMVTGWESMEPDTYYTYSTNLPVPHYTVPGLFYRGFSQASPDFSAELFVPLAAVTGDLARVRFFSPDPGGGSLSCLFPGRLQPGTPSGDSDGPEIEAWIKGYQGTPVPRVSGEVVYCAALQDSSGINLLPYPGAQLALYINGEPSDVSEYFVYDQGSSMSGRLQVPLQSLPAGMHQLRLRAADGLLNISWSEMEIEVLGSGAPFLEQVWIYPNPSSTIAGFHWQQSGPGPVDITLFTVTGRRLAQFRNLQGEPGYNQFIWNLIDADGDPVASGAYVYTVSSGDHTVTGVLAVTRN